MYICVDGWLHVYLCGWMGGCMYICVDGWVVACIFVWMNGWLHVYLCGWMGGCMYICVDGWLHVYLCGWVVACIFVWMDGWLHVYLCGWMGGCMYICVDEWVVACIFVWMDGWLCARMLIRPACTYVQYVCAWCVSVCIPYCRYMSPNVRICLCTLAYVCTIRMYICMHVFALFCDWF